MLSCYFPVVYTPPDDAPGKAVTRQELLLAVESALAPAFAPYVVPLLLEKMTSSLT